MLFMIERLNFQKLCKFNLMFQMTCAELDILKIDTFSSWCISIESAGIISTFQHSYSEKSPNYKTIPPSIRISVPVMKLATLLSDR